MSNPTALVQKILKYRNILRDDGLRPRMKAE